MKNKVLLNYVLILIAFSSIIIFIITLRQSSNEIETVPFISLVKQQFKGSKRDLIFQRQLSNINSFLNSYNNDFINKNIDLMNKVEEWIKINSISNENSMEKHNIYKNIASDTKCKDETFQFKVELLKQQAGFINCISTIENRQNQRNFNRKINHKLSIISPIRNRETHLLINSNSLRSTLWDLDLDYQIIVTEQNDYGRFNKGKLINAIYTHWIQSSDYFCVMNIDLIAAEPFIDFSYPSSPRHLGINVQQFEWKLLFPFTVCESYCINQEDFQRSNGYDNDMWGWGNEDEDFWLRLNYFGIPFNRANHSYFWEMEVGHTNRDKNENKHFNILKDSQRKLLTGYQQTDFQIESAIKTTIFDRLKFELFSNHSQINLKYTNDSLVKLNELKDYLVGLNIVINLMEYFDSDLTDFCHYNCIIHQQPIYLLFMNGISICDCERKSKNSINHFGGNKNKAKIMNKLMEIIPSNQLILLLPNEHVTIGIEELNSIVNESKQENFTFLAYHLRCTNHAGCFRQFGQFKIDQEKLTLIKSHRLSQTGFRIVDYIWTSLPILINNSILKQYSLNWKESGEPLWEIFIQMKKQSEIPPNLISDTLHIYQTNLVGLIEEDFSTEKLKSINFTSIEFVCP